MNSVEMYNDLKKDTISPYNLTHIFFKCTPYEDPIYVSRALAHLQKIRVNYTVELFSVFTMYTTA